MSFQDKINAVFKNKEILRNARSGLVIAIVIFLPLAYFAYKDQLSWQQLWSIEFAGISVIAALSAHLATKETKTRAYEDAFLFDATLKELQDKKNDNSDLINKLDPRMNDTLDIVDEYNDEKQEKWNEIKTNQEIVRLRDKARDYLYRGKRKKADKIYKEVEKLQEEGLIDKNFEPYDIRLIVSNTDNTEKMPKKKGNTEIKVNPKKTGGVSFVTRILFNSLGIGAVGIFSIGFTESFYDIFVFYLYFLLSISFIVFLNYTVTSRIMDVSFRRALKRTITIQEVVITKLQEQKEEPHKEEKSNVSPFNHDGLLEGV